MLSSGTYYLSNFAPRRGRTLRQKGESIGWTENTPKFDSNEGEVDLISDALVLSEQA